MAHCAFPVHPGDKQRFLEVIRQVLAMGDINREAGIGQGSPYSPLALNVVLHFGLDLPLSQNFGGNVFRYADNILFVSRWKAGCKEFLWQTEQVLSKKGLTLRRDEPRIIDLRKNAATVLGVTVHTPQP